MKRIPNGFRKISKEEFILNLINSVDEKDSTNELFEQKGIAWTSLNVLTKKKRSIRW